MYSKLSIWTASTLLVASCAALPIQQDLEQGCYDLNGLNGYQMSSLDLASGNPILTVGEQSFACTCYGDSELAGTSESSRLAGDSESGQLSGADEAGRLAGASETGSLSGAQESGNLSGAGETGQLAGASETGALAGASEDGQLAGASESGALAGASENGRLKGALASLSCNVKPTCSGFELTGIPQQDVMVSTSSGTSTVSSVCVVW